MVENIVDLIQQNLGYAPLHKIDPNTQEARHKDETPAPRKFEQAAIPAVLLGLYKYGSTEQGAQDILHGSRTADWLQTFYDESKSETINKVSDYASVPAQDAAVRMESIASEAVSIVKQHIPAGSDFGGVKKYITQQRNYVLLYLPAELQLGYLMNDNTLDDRTHKMEGPMSDSMHFIEKLFSGSTTEKNELRGE